MLLDKSCSVHDLHQYINMGVCHDVGACHDGGQVGVCHDVGTDGGGGVS